MMSKLGTPGYPAPDTACMLVTTTVSIPKASANGRRLSVKGTHTQFGLVTMNPFPESLYF